MSVIVELNGVTYYDENLAAAPTVYAANDLIGNELQADSLTVDIIAGSGGSGRLLTAYGEPVKDKNGNQVYVAGETRRDPVGVPVVHYGDVVTIWNAGHNRVIAKMYAESVERVAKSVYRVRATSAVGLLIHRTHYGGIYSGTAASDIFAELFGDVPHTLGTNVEGVLVYGHLPIATARDNLHILLQSLGASVLKDASGDVLIDFIDPTTAVSVSPSQTAMEGSVAYNAHASQVVVVEHSFLQTAYDEETVLFDNSNEAAVTDKVIPFDEPCYDLVAVGLSIAESGANYAIVSGVGTLSGKVYTHTREERVELTGATGEEKIVAVRDNELINTLNSGALAERLANYYGAANSASVSAAGSDFYSGHHVLFTNVYGEQSEGYVEEAETVLSVGLDKTSLRIATDYMPGPFGPDYDSFLIIDEPGAWSVPAELTGQKVKVCVFGGARGGQAGYDGTNGTRSVDGDPSGAPGGAGGAGGQGFMFYAEEIDLTEASYLVTIGTGGAGGASNGDLGSLGGNTEFGSLSSESGTEILQYLNLISGGIYGLAGDTGTAGGNGGQSKYYGIGGAAGGDVTYENVTYHGGAGGGYGQVYNDDYMHGGGGGGAAAGNDGADCTGPVETTYGTGVKFGGGDGADAIAPLQADGYAEGGAGGNGGGGGGTAGRWTYWTSGGYETQVYTAGTGGKGSSGGQGANGFVLMFYHS